MTTLKKTIGLFRKETGGYELQLDSSGDLKSDNSFDTDIYMSVFCDKRADSSEIARSELRRGWEGDVVSVLEGYELGSKVWIDKQSRWTQDTVNNIVADFEDALTHFVDTEKATRISVKGKRLAIGKIQVDVVFYIDNNEIEKFTTLIWKESIYA